MNGSETVAPTRVLIGLDALGDPGAASIVLGRGSARRDVLIVRSGGKIRAFENSCPHQGTPLETLAGAFFDSDRCLLVCSTHGARFRPGDGLCVAGPCAGQALKPVAIELSGGKVLLAGEPS